jgi:copper resistance protein B
VRPFTVLLGAAATVALAAPAAGQDHSMHGMSMPGMAMHASPTHVASKKPAAKHHAKHKTVARRRGRGSPGHPGTAHRVQSTQPADMIHGCMEGMDHSTMQGMDHSAMPGMSMPGDPQPQQSGAEAMPGMQMDGQHADNAAMAGMAGMPMEATPPAGTDLPAGNASPPPIPSDYAADRVFAPETMEMARHHLQQHHGGRNFSQVMFNLGEYQADGNGGGYRWDGEAWFGGDLNRFVLKSEGEGTVHGGLGSAEVQALYSRAIGPYFNLQAGVRQDIRPTPARTYATVGFEGLAPDFFEVEGALFLSNKGDLLGRVEGYQDFRLTQRLIFQPRAELNFAAQDVPEDQIGSGLSNAELGVRLRYEIRREFAPYVGVSWDRKLGDTARFARARGDDVGGASLVLGIRSWF